MLARERVCTRVLVSRVRACACDQHRRARRVAEVQGPRGPVCRNTWTRIDVAVKEEARVACCFPRV